MYGLYSRAACNQERLMMARVRYIYSVYKSMQKKSARKTSLFFVYPYFYAELFFIVYTVLSIYNFVTPLSTAWSSDFLALFFLQSNIIAGLPKPA